MTERLLFAVLIYLLYSYTLALPPPELMITEDLITETDSVTLHCRTPSYLTVFQCYIYNVDPHSNIAYSCMETLTATELLRRSKQSAPAVVQVKCFYTLKYGNVNSPSAHSRISSISIQTTDFLETTSRSEASTSVTPATDAMGSKSTPSASTTSPCPLHSSSWTLTITDGVFTSTLKPGGAASLTPPTPGISIFALIIAVTCFGVIVGVILIGLMLWRTVSEKRKRQKQEIMGEYHTYCTVAEYQSLPDNLIYSKVEAHQMT